MHVSNPEQFQKRFKPTEVMMLRKSDQPAEQVTFYRRFSYSPVIQLFQKLFLKLVKSMDLQFGFVNEHSRVDQIHKTVPHIERAL